jgi:tetratricopeptide (TPR) repeat protein
MMRTPAVILTVLSVVLAAAPAPAHEKLGIVSFPTSCTAAAQPKFDRAVALLHSFWFQTALDGFADTAKTDPGCAMAHWGTAMTLLGNPLAGPPSPKALAEGAAAVDRAKAANAKTQRERDYVAAIENFYRDADKVEHRTRAVAYERAMADLTARYPSDPEAAIFYALALNITLNPNDKTYANQLKAAAVLERAFAQQPDHPGVAHYLIHSYDFPPIAQKGLPAARRYAAIAPSAPHALHMPSHIFTRVGAWQESIDTNRASAGAAKEELSRQGQQALGSYNALHAMDYMVYGYMQLVKDNEARAVLAEISGLSKLDVEHFAAAYAFAAIPARYALERRQWADAAALVFHPSELSWDKFPMAQSITWFARGLGAARSGDVASARKDLERIVALRDRQAAAKSAYWAEQSEIQRIAVSAWIARAEGKNDEALALMRQAADREDATEKHPVTPGALFPAREMLGDMLLEVGRPADALAEFEASQRVDPNRFLGLYGAARAADQVGNAAKARTYYTQLVALARTGDTERAELRQARTFIGQSK